MRNAGLRFFLSLSFLFFAPSPAGAGVLLDRLEASVNASIILHSDLSKFRKQIPLRTQLDPFFTGTPLAEKGASASNDEITRFLVDEKVIAQSFPVADPDVELEIQSIQTSNRISRKELRQALSDQGYVFEDYFELIRISLMKRNLVDREIRPKVVITDEEIKNAWLKGGGKSRAAGPKQYSFRMIRVNTALYKSPAVAKSIAEEARKRVKGGEPIGEVAKSIAINSEDAEALEFKDLTENEISPLLKDAIRKLPPRGVSSVVGDAKTGFYVIELLSVGAAVDDAFEKSKEEVRSRLLTVEFRNQIEIWLAQKRQTAFIHYATSRTAGK